MELNREELDALLGAYAIDALDGGERDEVERLLDADPELADLARQLQEVATGLVDGYTADDQVPTTLRTDLLSAAVRQRPAGRHLANPIGPDLAPGVLWRRQLADLDSMLDQLRPEDWEAITSYDRPVGDLLAHLSAVLEQFATELGVGSFPTPFSTGAEHWPATEEHIAFLTARPEADTVAALRDVGGRISAALERLSQAELDAERTVSPLTLADRTRQQCFELWMHTDDVRHASGRSMLDPDPERICALSDLSARWLGFGMLVIGRDHPGRQGRLVLTGSGGGTWVTPLGFEATEPGQADDVVIVAGAVDYCRMAGKLLDIDELAMEVEGDAALALDLLNAAQAFTV